MRLLHACPPSCKRLRIDAETAGAAERRLRALELVDKMVAGGMGRLDALRAIGLARSTYYDWRRAFQRGGAAALKPNSTRPRSVRHRRWTDADGRAVLKLRAEHPYMGKARLRAMLARNGLALSVSTVGRILSKAIADGRIRPASFCEGRTQPKRRRSFDGAWADRWKYGAKAQAPGELVQVDHMTYTKDGRTLKEVPADSSSPAICPTTKHMVARVFWRATANRTPRAKARALPAGHGRGHALPDRLHPTRRLRRASTGGSEFRADFERACQDGRIPLKVLPPRRPQWRRQPAFGRDVERANRSARIEFWNRYDGPLTVADVAAKLADYEFFHNYVRPHTALDCRTPNEYLVHIEDHACPDSQSSERS